MIIETDGILTGTALSQNSLINTYELYITITGSGNITSTSASGSVLACEAQVTINPSSVRTFML